MKHLNEFSYEEALAFIHGALKLGSKLGLANIKTLLDKLGNPEARLRFIHVAGTNGKGTVTVSLAAILKAAGYKTGAYTSPFVYRFNERIQIDGKPVSDTLLAKKTWQVHRACKAMVEEGMAHPTEFEIVTAVAFLCYAEAGCDFVALEVGLGGRLDATNVIKNPICTAICRIGYDHMEYLGSTLSEIADEKCGILKEGVPAVVYCEQPEEAMEVIRERCRQKNAALRLSERPEITAYSYRGSTFCAAGYENLFLPLAGAHMVQNVSVTLEIVEVLREVGIPIPDSAVREGLQNVRHRGRLETISENPLFLLDGAHNADGIEALCDTIHRLFAGKKLVFITGMLADKEYEKAMEKTAGLAESVITVPVPSPRTLSAEALCEAAMPYHRKVYAAKTIEEAVQRAYEETPDVILAFGSLYMLGDVYKAQAAFEKKKDK